MRKNKWAIVQCEVRAIALGRMSGARRLQEANQALLGSAERVGEVFRKRADCYRARERRPGSEFGADVLCVRKDYERYAM